MSTVSTPIGDLFASNRRANSWRPAAGERVVLYGAGGFARTVNEMLRRAGAVVVHALDERGPRATSLPDSVVYRPVDDPLSPSERAATTAVVGVFNRDADPNEIERSLHALGYGRVVGVPELYETFAEALGERFWLARRADYESCDDRIQAADDLWADAPSRELYRAVLRFRLEWGVAPAPSAGPQYFPDDVPRTAKAMRFVDCGAYDGDTLAAVEALGLLVEQAFAFEPDTANFARLAARASDFARATGAGVTLWPCAVADRTETRRFRAGEGEAARMSAEGGDVVTAVALDDVLPAVVATDVKMDIEGAEMEALSGAEALIRRSHPRLAICVYHRPDHLWEIPLFVRDLELPYDYFLRSHGHFGFDLVMYAVPRVSG